MAKTITRNEFVKLVNSAGWTHEVFFEDCVENSGIAHVTSNLGNIYVNYNEGFEIDENNEITIDKEHLYGLWWILENCDGTLEEVKVTEEDGTVIDPFDLDLIEGIPAAFRKIDYANRS